MRPANSRTYSSRHTFDGQHQLILAPLQAGLLHSLLAEMKEAADLVTELGQGLVIRQGEPLHAADCIVPRSTSFIVYRKTIHEEMGTIPGAGLFLLVQLESSVPLTSASTGGVRVDPALHPPGNGPHLE